MCVSFRIRNRNRENKNSRPSMKLFDIVVIMVPRILRVAVEYSADVGK